MFMEIYDLVIVRPCHAILHIWNGTHTRIANITQWLSFFVQRKNKVYMHNLTVWYTYMMSRRNNICA